MCFCFISQLIYCIINQVPVCKHSTFNLLKTHSSRLLSNQLSLLPDQYLSNSVIVFTTNVSFILSNMIWYCTREASVSRVVFGYLALPSKDRDVTGRSRYFPV